MLILCSLKRIHVVSILVWLCMQSLMKTFYLCQYKSTTGNYVSICN
uniref:Uncharacterized protein n=1 Tax=Rhizophora mucronata TaxID=61149 RepID=A0A2P2P5A7_RHIMU